MGLDGVELVMAVEERFEIHIPDEEAVLLATPGKLKHFVLGKVREGDSPGCLTQRAFYRLRRAIEQTGETAAAVDASSPREPSSLRPSTLWCDLLPKVQRRRRWGDLALATDLNLPELVRPVWALVLVAVLAAGCASWAFVVVRVCWRLLGGQH